MEHLIGLISLPTLLELITYFADLILIILLILIIYVATYSYYNHYKIFLIGYLVTSLLFFILGEALGRIQGNNLILIPIYGAIELGWFSFVYYIHTRRAFFLYSTIPTFICLIYELNTVNFLSLNQLQSYTRSISALTLCLYTLGYSYSLLKYKWKNYQANIFALNASLLVYASFTCIYYLPLQLLISGNTNNILLFWCLNNLITFIFYLLMTKVLCNIPSKVKL